ncbi:hypothetical protein [Roseomonas populi]|uniref:Lipoprotein n=1 Tax=Roseomonas populi TaxID=3121582 RepID=A0ABT1X091_9PROT|nr:hypothetical protein [Roseomonas pecuniae]MCR0981516.1 hypothetical protein [Roseomonas pecuniae]
MIGRPVMGRRLALGAPLLLLACGGRDLPPLPPRPAGYAWLTPLRLNVADLEVIDTPVEGRVDPPAPILPAAEVARMGRDRVIPSGTTGQGRFVVEAATLLRSGDSVSVLLRARLEVMDGSGRRVAFAQAEARRSLSGFGSSAAARARAAETVMVGAMEDLNVEFELQVRRNLRDWLLETTPAAPVAPVDSPEGIERQDLPRG